MSSDKNIHRSTGRVLDILEIVSGNPGKYTLTEICRLTESPKSSLSPILQTLVNRGFLSLTHDLHYKIGHGAYQVGNAFLEQMDILDEIEKILSGITNVCSETSHFAILAGSDVLYIKKIDSPENIRMTSRAGNTMPAYGTAIGKALLMDKDLSELKRIYPGKLDKLSKNTITNLDDLYEQICEARATGFTSEIEESNDHIRCYAVPIKQKNQIIAAVSVAIPIFRYTDEVGTLVKTLLFNAQKKIEHIIKSVDYDFENLL